MGPVSNLADQRQRITDAAEAAGTIVVDAIPTTSTTKALLSVHLELDPFVQLLEACPPRILYLEVQEFAAEAMALAEMTSGHDDEEAGEIASSPRFKALVQKWHRRDGQAAWFSAAFLVDGVLHGLTLTEDWADTFNDAASALGETLAEERAAAAAREQSESQAGHDELVRDHAVQLQADPLFSAPKISREKRFYLAGRLFPELDRHTLAAVVDEAINKEWFDEGRRLMSERQA